jgi:hypothetical protein
MSKEMVTKLFVGGIVAVVAGLVVTVFAGLALWSAGGFEMSGPDVTGIRPTPATASMIAIAFIGVLGMAGGAIAGLVAWIGALVNTSQLEDKTWFIALLVLGLFSFGFVAMIAYVLAGPDSTEAGRGHAIA